jgi:hypothetical protein
MPDHATICRIAGHHPSPDVSGQKAGRPTGSEVLVAPVDNVRHQKRFHEKTRLSPGFFIERKMA